VSRDDTIRCYMSPEIEPLSINHFLCHIMPEQEDTILLLCNILLIYHLKFCFCCSILFDGKNISFDASLVIYINSTNIPPIMIINRICENQNLLSL
jgi:uncharacterized membrane protein SirB2